jgi:3-methylfumaryl-CoA hydratase
MTTIDIASLKTWVGRQNRVADSMDPFPARALAAALGDETIPKAGDCLAPSWHWLYFLETPSLSGTASDGHPLRGGFLPPVPLPRRMWAAGTVEILQPLRLGRPAEKTSAVQAVELKTGRSGELVFVTIEHKISQAEVLCIREEQTLVYRGMPTTALSLAETEQSFTDDQWSRIVNPDPVLLFRYSALTYNSHRIHYDRDYATRVELYPGLVVHAPLLVTLLLDLARHEGRLQPLRRFRFRAVRPTFDLGIVHLRGRRDGSNVTMWSEDHHHRVGVKVSASVDEA